MPSTVAYATVTSLPLAAPSVTVNVAVVVPVLPSTTVRSPIDSAGAGSSSVIVPAPVPSASVAFDGAESVTV